MSFVKGWGPDYNRKDIKGKKIRGHKDNGTLGHEDMSTRGYKDMGTWGHDCMGT